MNLQMNLRVHKYELLARRIALNHERTESLSESVKEYLKKKLDATKFQFHYI